MNKLAKISGIICTAALMTNIFAGCGTKEAPASPQGTTKAAEQKTAAPKPVSLRFSWWGGETRHKATLDAISLYKQKFSHVTIEAEYQGYDGYEQKLKTQLAGGSAPDLMQVDQPWLPELTSRADTMFLDLYKNSNMELKGFDSTFLKNFCEYGGKLAGVPMGINGKTLIINKAAADKMGIDLSKPFDWDRLLEEAKKLRAKDNKFYLMNADLGVASGMLKSYLKQKTGDTLFKDDYTIAVSKADMVTGFTWIKNAFDSGVYQSLGESQLFTGKTEQNPKWINQETIMIEDWSSGVGKYKGTLPKDTAVDVVLPPVMKDAKSGAAMVRPSMVMSVNSKASSIDEAVKFTSWLMNDKEAALVLGDQRAVPATETARKAITEANKLDKEVAKAVELASKSQAKPDNALSTNSQLDEILKDIVQKVTFNKATPEQAADELIKRCTDKLKELKDAKK